ncbi:hypothetical protein [Streptomyces zaehneri]|uniref:hypothetical protein n=1 Tax=Streptomyces zaehneri TaxID=3051180 RepID=UPI0028D8485A|nr:hypothetical protein [Streptomyces sp. DSM 40713]
MFELLLLVAIAYAGARGVEKVAGVNNRRYDTPESREVVEKVAASGSTDDKTTTVVKSPSPTEPGGTFSSRAPRSAKVGGKAAYPLAVITETGSTMWKAVGEGYRERWPEIREEHRRKMEVKAEERRRKKEELEAKRRAEAAQAKAGPRPPYPPYPPKPTEPPKTVDLDAKADDPDANEKPEEAKAAPATPEDGTGIPFLTGGPYIDLNAALDQAIKEAEAKAERAKKEAEEARSQAARDKVLAAQKEAREAKEREAAAEERARAAEAKASEPKPAGTEPEAPAQRRHLSVVPDPAQNGDFMSSPASVIPEIRTLDGLMNALTLTKAMCEMRSEEAIAIAADDKALSDRLDQIEAELADLEVDDKTRAEIDELRDSIRTQSQAAAAYGAAAKDAGDFAVAAAAAAYKSHGGIAEAVQSSPVERAAQAGYYDR